MTLSSHLAPRRSRQEWHALFAAMRAEGLTGTEIARCYGVGHTFVYEVLNDPDRSKELARRARYGRACIECGARTDGSDGRAKAPKRCLACSRAAQSAAKKWTREAVIAAIQRFAQEHGRPPKTREWQRAENGYPSFSSVYAPKGPFPRWLDAIRAAGLSTDQPRKAARGDAA